jgi:hypothetical protein
VGRVVAAVGLGRRGRRCLDHRCAELMAVWIRCSDIGLERKPTRWVVCIYCVSKALGIVLRAASFPRFPELHCAHKSQLDVPPYHEPLSSARCLPCMHTGWIRTGFSAEVVLTGIYRTEQWPHRPGTSWAGGGRMIGLALGRWWDHIALIGACERS